MSAIILDTETTGLTDPQVIELAYMGPLASSDQMGDHIVLRFKPSCAISLGAMSTHHIIDSDLVDCEPWRGAWTPPAGIDYLVGHNVDFDWKAIGSPDIKRICTLALARARWPELDSHCLGALIYHLYPKSLARTMLRNAHCAGVDVVLCFQVLTKMLSDPIPAAMTWEHLWQTSEKARVPSVMPFGKHKGLPMSQVPRDYKLWLLAQPDVDPYLAKALRQ